MMTRYRKDDYICCSLSFGKWFFAHWHVGDQRKPHIRLRCVTLFSWMLPLRYSTF